MANKDDSDQPDFVVVPEIYHGQRPLVLVMTNDQWSLFQGGLSTWVLMPLVIGFAAAVVGALIGLAHMAGIESSNGALLLVDVVATFLIVVALIWFFKSRARRAALQVEAEMFSASKGGSLAIRPLLSLQTDKILDVRSGLGQRFTIYWHEGDGSTQQITLKAEEPVKEWILSLVVWE